MEKSLFRAFIFSLLLFFGINFIIYLMSYSLGGLFYTEIDRISIHPTHGVFLLLYPSRYFPWELIFNSIDVGLIEFTVFFIGGFVSFIVAAILAGLMGGDIRNSFGGWILTCISYISMHIAILVIDDYNLTYLTPGNLINGIVLVIITGVANMLIFGGLVILIAHLKGKE